MQHAGEATINAISKIFYDGLYNIDKYLQRLRRLTPSIDPPFNIQREIQEINGKLMQPLLILLKESYLTYNAKYFVAWKYFITNGRIDNTELHMLYQNEIGAGSWDSTLISEYDSYESLWHNLTNIFRFAFSISEQYLDYIFKFWQNFEVKNPDVDVERSKYEYSKIWLLQCQNVIEEKLKEHEPKESYQSLLFAIDLINHDFEDLFYLKPHSNHAQIGRLFLNKIKELRDTYFHKLHYVYLLKEEPTSKMHDYFFSEYIHHKQRNKLLSKPNDEETLKDVWSLGKRIYFKIFLATLMETNVPNTENTFVYQDGENIFWFNEHGRVGYLQGLIKVLKTKKLIGNLTADKYLKILKNTFYFQKVPASKNFQPDILDTLNEKYCEPFKQILKKCKIS